MGAAHSPPYVFSELDSGIEIEIAQQALEQYNLSLNYMTFVRALMEVNNGHIDFMSRVPKGFEYDGYLSDVHVFYQPSAFFLKSKCDITSLEDMNRYSIASFQGASKYLGEKYLSTVSQSPHYHELTDVSKLVQLLQMNRVDVVLVSHSIFTYSWQKEGFDIDMLGSSDALPMVPARMLFRKEQLRDEFNQGLKRIIDSGQYRAIIEKYLPQDTVEKIMQRVALPQLNSDKSLPR